MVLPDGDIATRYQAQEVLSRAFDPILNTLKTSGNISSGTITRNASGQMTTLVMGSRTWTFTRDANGRITGWTVS